MATNTLGNMILTILIKSKKKILGLPDTSESSTEDSPNDDVVIELRQPCSLGDLIMAPVNDTDRIYNLNALLLAYRNSVSVDSKCFEIMYHRAVWLNKWISRLVHLITLLTLLISGVGVISTIDMQPYITGSITFLFGINGYKDHENLESGVEALDQCVSFTNELYTDINYFLYRSQHSVEALNVFVSAVDDKLKIFDRTTRLPIPLVVKNNILDLVKIEKQSIPPVPVAPRSIYKIKRKHKSPRNDK